MSKIILFASPTASLGGAERVMCNLALEYLESGCTVIFYVMSGGDRPGWAELTQYSNFKLVVRDFKSEKRSLICFAWSIYRISRLYSLDLVISSHTHVNGCLSLLRKLRVLKCRRLVARESTVIFERFSGWKKNIFYLIYKYAYGAQDLIVCQTEYMLKSLVASLGFHPASNVLVINNPVNLVSIDRRQGEPSLDKQLIDNGYAIACGRCIQLKQFDVLIKAYAASLYKSEIHLVLIGDGPELSKLKVLAEELRVSDRINFLGYVENPIPYFRYANVGVLSSSIEGFPNVILEMMASGVKKIVSTPCTEAIFSLPNIVVSKDASCASLADALREAIKVPEVYACEYRETIEERYSTRSFIETIERA